MFKFLKWDFIASNSVAVLTTSIVAVTAMYATLTTTDKNLEESRRGTRVSAFVDEWWVTIADSAAAMQQDGCTAWSNSLTIVRELARIELDTAGTDSSSVKCNIPDKESLWKKLSPEDSAS